MKNPAHKVSIPYGTIKSGAPGQFNDNRFVVSIPYGTIKSICLHSYYIFGLCFNSLWYD